MNAKDKKMNSLLYVIVDTSGSMGVMGKMHIQKRLCRCINQIRLLSPEKYSALNIQFFRWGTTVTEIDVQNNKEDFLGPIEGSSDIFVLSDFLLGLNSTPVVLLLSDGYFSNPDALDFKKLIDKQYGFVLRPVAVGSDSNIRQLKKLSSGDRVDLAEDIVMAVDSVVFHGSGTVKPPKSINQILP